MGKEEDKGGDSDGKEKKVSGVCGSFTTISVFPERYCSLTWLGSTALRSVIKSSGGKDVRTQILKYCSFGSY